MTWSIKTQWGSNPRRRGLLFWESSKTREKSEATWHFGTRTKLARNLALSPDYHLLPGRPCPSPLITVSWLPAQHSFSSPQHPTSWKVLTQCSRRAVSHSCAHWVPGKINGGELLTNQAKQSLSLRVLLPEARPSIHSPASSKWDLRDFKETSSPLRQARKTGSSGIV